MAEIKYEILEKIGVLTESGRGWRKELNLISWNDRAPQIRSERMVTGRREDGKGNHLIKRGFGCTKRDFGPNGSIESVCLYGSEST